MAIETVGGEDETWYPEWGRGHGVKKANTAHGFGKSKTGAGGQAGIAGSLETGGFPQNRERSQRTNERNPSLRLLWGSAFQRPFAAADSFPWRRGAGAARAPWIASPNLTATNCTAFSVQKNLRGMVHC